MTVSYQVLALHVDRPGWLAKLRQSVASELMALGVHKSLNVNVTEELLDSEAPAVAVLLVGPATKNASSLDRRIIAARDSGLVVIPVVDSLAAFAAQVPDLVSAFNGFEWSGGDPERRLARIVLKQLGIEERDRKVFISHRRSDGLAAAEQLYDALSHVSFSPFIDRFAIPAGDNVQLRIADALESFAFVLLLETPDAHASDWVFDELEYALAHSMGVLIVTWPDEPPPIPGSDRLPRVHLQSADLVQKGHGFDALSSEAVDRVLREVESAHALGLVRRRKMLLSSVQSSAEAGGATCTALKDWSMDVSGPSGRSIVAVAPRLPESEDLHRLDEMRNSIQETADALLIHAARQLEASRKRHLDWAKGDRNLRMISENAVGGLW
ncbi:toll/interleukin-1 receptor domain-containing protein [Ruania alkalisoli]|uniref:Toll/interleukin-1 receptor domain-containing protein n=1 Tax=Ruania alkalisoli TaxID=2779775 RepID=A0A7M1SP99_9MICO|nr:toll/interleukin-1 receptor domain-containing protein [Ruania alkalisoli]QOR69380.1 toll/interleukin-1 receptor domain-containing protein [Ruania alkalisoli]